MIKLFVLIAYRSAFIGPLECVKTHNRKVKKV